MIRGSNFGPETGYADFDFPELVLVNSGTVPQVGVTVDFLHVLINSTHNPTIRRRTVWATDTVDIRQINKYTDGLDLQICHYRLLPDLYLFTINDVFYFLACCALDRSPISNLRLCNVTIIFVDSSFRYIIWAFRKTWVRISTPRPAVLTEQFCDFLQRPRQMLG